MAHQQMRFHLPHRVEHHADHDQHARAAEKSRNRIRNLQQPVQNDRNYRDDGQENSARQRDAAHGVVQVIASRRSRPDTGHIAAVLLQIIGDLQLVELRGHPEIREEQNHQTVNHQVKESALVQRNRDLLQKPDVVARADRLEYFLGEHQNGLRKNHRHHARIIHLQRHERRAALIHFPAHGALGVLHRNLPLRLRHRDDPGNDAAEQKHERRRVTDVEMPLHAAAREKHVRQALPRHRQPRQDAHRDDQRDAVAYAALRHTLHRLSRPFPKSLSVGALQKSGSGPFPSLSISFPSKIKLFILPFFKSKVTLKSLPFIVA